jgi:hypothetical protein
MLYPCAHCTTSAGVSQGRISFLEKALTAPVCPGLVFEAHGGLGALCRLLHDTERCPWNAPVDGGLSDAKLAPKLKGALSQDMSDQGTKLWYTESNSLCSKGGCGG